MKLKKSILGLFLFPLIFSCATMPTIEEMKNEAAEFQLPRTPKPDKATVYIVRPASLGWLIRFNVFLDGKEEHQEVGSTLGNQYIYFDVDPGKHVIYSEAEVWDEKEIEAKPGEVIFLEQVVKLGIIMARNTLYDLPDYQGKYYVKHGNEGTILETAFDSHRALVKK